MLEEGSKQERETIDLWRALYSCPRMASLYGGAPPACNSKAAPVIRVAEDQSHNPAASARATRPEEHGRVRSFASPKGQLSAVEYVVRLFDEHDVVVLCERQHDEDSQWEFIYEIVSDPRFIERVGRVFTEYGQVSMQDYLGGLLDSGELTSDKINEGVVHVMRNLNVWPVWANTNFYTYLTRLRRLNQSLPADRRVHHYLTDKIVVWSDLTDGQRYREHLRTTDNRDEWMVQTVIETMGRLAQTAQRPPKCLVVMNYRHAFDLTGRNPESKRRNTYEFLKDALGTELLTCS